MNVTTVMITGCGAPGTVGTVWSLRNNADDQNIRVVGVDAKEDAVGKYICDIFHQVPMADDELFIEEVLSICVEESVDVLLPQVTAELKPLSAVKPKFTKNGISIAVSSNESVSTANNKKNLMDMCDELDIPRAETYSATSESELYKAAEELGYPDTPFVVKPPASNGKRGFRVVSNEPYSKERFYEEKPRGDKITLDNLNSILGENFPELLIMEYLPGKEYSVDGIRSDGHLSILPRSRDQIRSGISFKTTLTEDDKMVELSRKMAKHLDLEYAFGFQFIRDSHGSPKIIECNPRIQGSMVASTLAGVNIPYLSVKAALGDDLPETSIDWDTTFHRYWGGFGIGENKLKGNIGKL